MKKILIGASVSLMAVLASSAWADENVNLTADVRTKLAAWKQDANFTALADISDVETKPGWDAIKDNKRLIGTWRNRWCFTWNASPKKGIVLVFE